MDAIQRDEDKQFLYDVWKMFGNSSEKELREMHEHVSCLGNESGNWFQGLIQTFLK
ncbi:hypothetical protein [Paenibacillus glacialis]|uniref:hypothetical protein n=1 Tax=Paenibacillus glacialis TaxID=494026 RepID=UPI000B2363AF|nr:hypothetical protein [Paenibacillus glacialis]